MTEQFSPETLKVLGRIQKLLDLAAKGNTTEEEAASAAAKAQELLLQYNLDAAMVERASGVTDGRREDAKLKGGFYQYQEDLWRAVAKLHFCLYWCQTYHEEREYTKKYYDGSTGRYTRSVALKRHRLVGRIVNTKTAIALAQYLEKTVERLTRERLNNDGTQFFIPWAYSYRQGCVDRIVEKVGERFRARLRADALEQAEKEAKARAAGAEGFSSATALTLSTYVSAEHDANADFVFGEGYSARKAARRAEEAAEQAQAEAEYTAWAAANPEEARKQEEEDRKAQRKRPWNYGMGGGGGRGEIKDYGGYRAGYDAGEGVSIDQQVDSGSRTKIGRAK